MQSTRRAFRWFLVVVVVCVGFVSWWMACEVKQANQVAELSKAQLELRSAQLAIQLNEQVSSLWQDFNLMAKDSTWTGSIPRRLMENPLVLSHNWLPTVTRRIQSPFGHYDLDNWTWAFQGRKDTLYVTLDPSGVAKVVEANDSSFEFRGEAALPGMLPYPLDPLPVRPKPEKLAQVDRDRERELLIHGSGAALFLLVTIGAAFRLYRSVPARS